MLIQEDGRFESVPETVDALLYQLYLAIREQDEWRIVLLNDAAVSGPTGF